MKKIPQRTCAYCRNKLDKNKLFRIVRTKEGEIFYDPSGKANGRGAYVCNKQQCIDSIEDNLLNRVFKIDIDYEDKKKVKNSITDDKIRMEKMDR